MGMYTEIHFNSGLHGDTPSDVIAVLKYMLGDTDGKPSLPGHELFTTTRWPVMLRMDSCYFDADTHSTLRYDDIANNYYLCVRSNLKNYGQEIEKFVDWIMPYLDKYCSISHLLFVPK